MISEHHILNNHAIQVIEAKAKPKKVMLRKIIRNAQQR
jgi:hypothetical protein